MSDYPLRVIELFGGIGACSKALSRIGIPHVISDYVENDKYAVASFNAIHGTDFAPQDIKVWDKSHYCPNCHRVFDTGKFDPDDNEFYDDVCPYCGGTPCEDIRGNIDLIMHGSPCQDFSAAGLGKGGDEGSGTRSSLMYETIRIVDKIRPQYVVWENVKNILSKKHKHNFDAYLDRMKELGYTNYFQVLNAKNYGIPQNRERVFTISIRGDQAYTMPQGEPNENQIDRLGGMYGQTTRWGVYNKEGLAPTLTAAMGEGGGHTPMVPDFEFPEPQPLDKTTKDFLETDADPQYDVTDRDMQTYSREFGSRGKEMDIDQPAPTLTASMGTGGGNIPYFKFPEPQQLKMRLKDILESQVDESFYLSDEQVKKIKMSTYNQNRLRIQDTDDVARTLCARDWKDPKCVTVKRVGGMYDNENGTHQAGSVYDADGLSPTLSTMQGGNREPIIVDDTYANRDAREYDEYSPALRSERSGLKVMEPQSALVQPVDRDYNKHGGKRETQIEVKSDGISHTLRTNGETMVAEPFIAASRGRNPENPSDRTPGAPTEQRLEPKYDGTTNTLTSVQKDNYVVEPQGFVEGAYQEFADKNGYVPDAFNPYNQAEVGDVAPTQTTQCGSTTSSATVLLKEEQPTYRVRKLTPKECWRLMGFDDVDFDKAAQHNSKTQLYKQAGNSIVVNVLEKIFTNLLK